MKSIPKVKSGINGLDEITGGGLPKGRPTLECGGTGRWKTYMAKEFIVKGAQLENEPGVFIAIEEKAGELSDNVQPLGFDHDKLQRNKKLRLHYVRIDKSEIEQTAEYDLD